MNSRKPVDLLVVGAGPVGLFTALTFARRGLEVRIIDRANRTNLHSYALCLHARSLDLFDDLGVVAPLMESGRRITRTTVYDECEPRLHIPHDACGTRHRHALVVWQSSIELALLSALQTSGVQVEWNCELTGLEPVSTRVEATVTRIVEMAQGYPWTHVLRVRDGMEKFEAHAVISSDGYHSTGRRSMRSAMVRSGAPVSYSVFEFRHSSPVPDEQNVILTPDSANVMWPMGEDMCRMSFEEPATERFGLASAEDLHHFINERAPWFGPEPERLEWSTRARFESYLVMPRHVSRAMLVGDAAHLAPPIGVHSMNMGFAEVARLAPRLEEVIRLGKSTALLDEWDRDESERWLKYMTPDSVWELPEGTGPWARQNFARLRACVPATGEDLPLLMSAMSPVESGAESEPAR